MATILAALRSLLPCVALAATLTGCLGGGDEPSFGDEDTELAEGAEPDETGHDAVVEVGEQHSAGVCAKRAVFTFERSGDTMIAAVDGEPVAWFTDGAYTVRMAGPSRSFSAGSVTAPGVVTTAWVRTMSEPFDAASASEAELAAWLDAARGVNCEAGTKDVLAIAYEYVEGAKKDARYALGADFHDYLGLSWDPVDAKSILPDVGHEGSLDCSGYMRLVWGSRTNLDFGGESARIPLSLKAVTGHLPRSSEDMYRFGPGKLVVPFRTQPAGAPAFQGAPTTTELARIQPGDLVFFDSACSYVASTALACGKDPSVISHVGMFVDRDTSGNYRFISSRATANGPTVGNTGGWSVFNGGVDGSGSYPQRFRAARRL
ncbi:hypothetical protein [Polyangium spumosum]|uniref:NlpC/P60 domain-containing protein n=1 Tax=Polyangium spumosum TaxID=889282 RepID=A0A6N7PXS4_9BACT|nr:hypothetical protein [Polyangium spumosum]MRG95045.1 hypothetical protein [Polyangium spumosum]